MTLDHQSPTLQDMENTINIQETTEAAPNSLGVDQKSKKMDY